MIVQISVSVSSSELSNVSLCTNRSEEEQTQPEVSGSSKEKKKNKKSKNKDTKEKLKKLKKKLKKVKKARKKAKKKKVEKSSSDSSSSSEEEVWVEKGSKCHVYIFFLFRLANKHKGQ